MLQSFPWSSTLGKHANSSALIFNVLSVPVQFLQDVREIHTDTIGCTAESTQIAEGQKGENTDTRKITVIPEAPSNAEIQANCRTCHTDLNDAPSITPRCTQKTNHVRNVEPSHPPFGGIELEMATIGI